MTTGRIVFMAFIQAMYLFLDSTEARWLPWWRRFAPSACISIMAFAEYVQSEALARAAFVVWCVAFFANWWTSRRNKRNGKDFKAKEAAEAKLTDVDQRAFNRQAAEAHP
jgi:hypothetical protein